MSMKFFSPKKGLKKMSEIEWWVGALGKSWNKYCYAMLFRKSAGDAGKASGLSNCKHSGASKK